MNCCARSATLSAERKAAAKDGREGQGPHHESATRGAQDVRVAALSERNPCRQRYGKNFGPVIRRVSFGVIFALLIFPVLGGCVTSYDPPGGLFSTNVTVNRFTATPGELGARWGESCATGVLGLFSSGDAGIRMAAAAGGIKVIRAVDYRVESTFIFYRKVCTIVYGD